MSGEQPQKRVTWAELFFDLVFVLALIQVSVLLGRDHSWLGLGRALIVFVIVYWSWVGATQYGNLRIIAQPPELLAIFVLGASGLLMALAVPDAYHRYGTVFGGAYLFLQIVLTVLLLRDRRRIRFGLSSLVVGVTGPLLLIGGLLGEALRAILWGVAAAINLSLPWLYRRQLASIRLDPSHLSERFALLLIIALGESMVEIGFAALQHPFSWARLVAVVAGYALACSLWWVYFVFAIRAVRLAMEEARVQSDIVRAVLLYGHLFLVIGVIGVAVGLAEVVAAPGDELGRQSAILLVGGCAVYLATFGYTRWRIFRTVSWHRLGTALACLVFLVFATLLPGLAVVLMLVALTVALNAVEGAVVRRRGLRHLWHLGPALPSAPESAVPPGPGESAVPPVVGADEAGMDRAADAAREADRGAEGPAVGS